MTQKAALAGLTHGGGKAVIIGDPRLVKTPALLRDFAAAVNALQGRYITAEDVGTTEDDMNLIRETTPFVAGTATLARWIRRSQLRNCSGCGGFNGGRGCSPVG